MTYLFLGVIVLLGLLLLARWYVSAEIRTLKKVLKWSFIGAVCMIGLFFIISGRMAWAFFVLPILLPLILRARSAARLANNFARMSRAATGGGSSGQTSDVETRFLRMCLDHDTGEMTGIVNEGPYAGWALTDLTLEQLFALWRLCREEDEPSAQVLEAFLDRTVEDWRDRASAWAGDGAGSSGSRSAGYSGAMTRGQALSVLGLEEGATKKEIKAAYQRIISGLHPDHGGSDYLAAQVNEAKAVLLDD